MENRTSLSSKGGVARTLADENYYWKFGEQLGGLDGVAVRTELNRKERRAPLVYRSLLRQVNNSIAPPIELLVRFQSRHETADNSDTLVLFERSGECHDVAGTRPARRQPAIIAMPK